MDMIKIFGKWLYSFNNQAVMWAQPDAAGYLDKRGGNFATWKTRFFILQGSTLFYFPNPFSIQIPLGVLPMEGSGLEAAGVQEGGPQRKWCFKIKLGAQFGMAKRSVYVFSAPSKQAQEEWLENLKYAASARADLIAYLHKSRRVGADLRFKLYKSPANRKMIEESRRGPEGDALQGEIMRLRSQLISLNQQALEIKSQCDQIEANVMLALAGWDLFAQHVAGKNGSDYTNKLQSEFNLTRELAHLLATKVDYMQGRRLQALDEDARMELQKICEKALTKIEEHQAKIRIRAPRYTTEVNPYIFPENDEKFKHTSDIFIICSKVTANKKLLALQRRAANENEKEARSGWIISKIGSIKSVASESSKSTIKDIAAKFSKEMFNVNTFVDTELLNVNKFVEEKTTAVKKFIDKGKVAQARVATATQGKVHQLAAKFGKDLTNFNEFVDKEMQSTTKFIDNGKAKTIIKEKTPKQASAITIKGGVSKTEASLGWKALNKMKLQRFRLQSTKMKSKIFSSFSKRAESAESISSQRFRFNPKHLPAIKPRPKSANASVSAADFLDIASFGSTGASTSSAPIRWTQHPRRMENPPRVFTPEKHYQQFQAQFNTSASDSSRLISEDERSSENSSDEETGFDPRKVKLDLGNERKNSMVFYEEEEMGPELRKGSKDAHAIVVDHSRILETIPGFRPNSLNHLS